MALILRDLSWSRKPLFAAAWFQAARQPHNQKEVSMSESVYKVIQLVGTSPKSFEDAARNAVETASKSIRDLRVAEIDKLDLKVEDGKVVAFRARVQLSFKYKTE
jgi:flavin-binding protein dodecin